MATHTPNLGLKKPAGTDYVLVGDLNGNMDAVDGAIGKLANLTTPEKTNLVEAINQAALMGGEHAPYIGANGHWWLWNTGLYQYDDSGIHATGPTGPIGAQGVGGTMRIESVLTGPPGSEATIVDTVESTPENRIYILTVPRGETGENGQDFTVYGVFPTLAALKAVHPAGAAGLAYAVGTAEENEIYIWDVEQTDWVSIGPLRGAKGQDGTGAGDMTKAVYDAAGNGVVDDAEKLGGVAAAEYARKTDVPTDALRYDTPQTLTPTQQAAVREKIGAGDVPDGVVQYVAQTLTGAEQAQARQNIGAAESGAAVKPGGAPGQVYVKAGAANYDAAWQDLDTDVTADDVGLGNVDNTADMDKPVSTAMQAALDGKSDTGHVHSQYLTGETDPTVSPWAKEPTKPDYTAEEVGAVPIAGGTMAGTLVVGNPAVNVSAVRNVIASTTDLTAGTSALATGTLYLVYE